MLLSNVSTENLETTENWVVTKPKKKSKKRRNSISSGARRQNSNSESTKQPANRAPSPDLRGNTTRSVPHSEKSNDSSDADSVHSLPIDDLNMPVSYADIAKNSEKLKEKKTSPEKIEKIVVKEKSPSAGKVDQEVKVQQISKKSPALEKNSSIEKNPLPHFINNNISKSPPDVNNMKNFPAISVDNSKGTTIVSPTSKYQDPEEVSVKNHTEVKVQRQDISPELQLVKSPISATIATDVVVNVKSTPSSSSSSSSSESPKAVQEVIITKNLPPDVHNIRSFPAMPVVNKTLNVSEKNLYSTRNSLSVSNNKIRNISPGNNNNKSAKSGHHNNNNNNNNLKSSARNASNMVHNDIQNDLTVSKVKL